MAANPSMQSRAQLLAHHVDGYVLAFDHRRPVGPAVAAGRALDRGADLVDRAAVVGGDDRSVGAHLRGVAPAGVSTLHIYRGVMPFIVIQLLMLGLLAWQPELATWLPDTVYAGP